MPKNLEKICSNRNDACDIIAHPHGYAFLMDIHSSYYCHAETSKVQKSEKMCSIARTSVKYNKEPCHHLNHN